MSEPTWIEDREKLCTWAVRVATVIDGYDNDQLTPWQQVRLIELHADFVEHMPHLYPKVEA